MNILEGTHNPRPGDEVTIREVDGIFAVEGTIDYKEFKGKLFVYQTESGEFNGWDWTPEKGVDQYRPSLLSWCTVIGLYAGSIPAWSAGGLHETNGTFHV